MTPMGGREERISPLRSQSNTKESRKCRQPEGRPRFLSGMLVIPPTVLIDKAHEDLVAEQAAAASEADPHSYPSPEGRRVI